jgi:hypothetical protein
MTGVYSGHQDVRTRLTYTKNEELVVVLEFTNEFGSSWKGVNDWHLHLLELVLERVNLGLEERTFGFDGRHGDQTQYGLEKVERWE